MSSQLKINNVQFNLDTPEREARFNRIRAHGCEEAFKMNREQWFNNPPQHIIADFPLHVDLELSSVCNLNCPMCPTGTEEFNNKVEKKFMDFELFKKIVDECAAAKLFSIRLSWIGEATLHPQFIECIHYAKQKGICEVSLLTNGKKFIEKAFCERAVDAGLDWVSFSIDGVDETYERIRKPIKFNEIVLALQNLVDLRNEKKMIKPAIKIQGVWPAVKVNLEKYLSVFTPLSDLIYSNPLIDFAHQSKPDDKDLLPDFTCYQPFQRIVVRSNGKVVMCSNDDCGENIIGDAYKMTIANIWHGDLLNSIRELHLQHRALHDIDACNRCYVPKIQETEVVLLNGRIIEVQNYKGVSQRINE